MTMANSRQQAIETAERLFRAQGYAGTGLAQIIIESGSPKGSFYFNFPGGKHELALEALQLYGDRINQRIRDVTDRHGDDPIKFVRHVCAAQAREMEASGWTMSCLAHQLANELSPAEEDITVAVARIFQSWVASMSTVLRQVASSDQEARLLATAFISGLSGARTLSRVARSKLPFDSLASTMTQMMQSVSARSAAAVTSTRRRTRRVRPAAITH